jgi:hypothetical protein
MKSAFAIIALVSMQLPMLANASVDQYQLLPSATVSAKSFGGTVLMLRMKYTLVVDGGTQSELNRELGESARSALFHDMIMDKNADELRASFATSDRPKTSALIEEYAKLVN